MLGLAEVLRAWLDHRRDVLLRRTNHRLRQIEDRLEVLGGYLVAYLNLDRVIKIIRTEDEPKPVLMRTFKLTEVQADAILNMRLRNLRKLEEMEIKTEDREICAPRSARRCSDLVGSETGAVEDDRRRDQGGAHHVRSEDAARQAPHHVRPGAGLMTRRRSKRRW